MRLSPMQQEPISFKKDIDTIFEIGGQDAKYVYLKNGVPIDYAMNEPVPQEQVHLKSLLPATLT